MDNKKNDEVGETQATEQVEQSIWSVRINSQILYQTAVDGRTILLGMTAEENMKVKEVMEKAIDDLAKILEKRTTQHQAPQKKEPVTVVDTSRQEQDTSSDTTEEVAVEEKEELETEKPATAPQSRVERGPGGKFVSKKASKKSGENGDDRSDDDEEKTDTKKSDSGWNSIMKKLRS